MAQKQELEIKISEDGQVTIAVVGGKGQSCLRLTGSLEDALGKVVDRELLSEFYDGAGPDEEVRLSI